jgi:hypothetical protein
MVEGGLPESDVADASILEIQEHTKELMDRNKEMNITLGSNWNDNQRSALSEVKEQFEKETGSLRNFVAGWIKQVKHTQQNPIAAEPGPRTHVLPLQPGHLGNVDGLANSFHVSRAPMGTLASTQQSHDPRFNIQSKTQGCNNTTRSEYKDSSRSRRDLPLHGEVPGKQKRRRDQCDLREAELPHNERGKQKRKMDRAPENPRTTGQIYYSGNTIPAKRRDGQ